jgi:hypothetical protein
MRSDKLARAMQEYNGFKGPQTLSHVMSTIPSDLCNELVGRQIGTVMSIRNAAYHEGAAAAIKELSDFIGLPSGVSLWDVVGDKDYLGYKTFSDGLHIPNILESRGQQVSAWKAEDKKETESKQS